MSLKTDLECLVECLRFQQDDTQRGKDTLLTIASLCSTSKEAQNFLRTSGGLSYMVNLLSTTDDDGLKVAAVYALGCATERNVFSQTRLCTEAMFRFLYCLLNNGHSDVKMKRTATFLIMCLVTNNGTGQTLVRKSKCLDALLHLFRKFPGIPMPYSPDCSSSQEGEEDSCLELWIDVTGTLCGCVNNPQNDENQLVCASSLPAALHIMSRTNHPKALQLLCSFLSLLTANNAVNQDRLHMVGGLETIVIKLTAIVDAVVNDPDKETIAAASNMISMINSAMTENETNMQALCKLEVVPQLLKLLPLDVINQEMTLKIIITLGCLVAANGDDVQKQIVESDGLKLVLNAMMSSRDEECVKAATIVLHSCVNAMSSSGTELEIDVETKDACSDDNNNIESDEDNVSTEKSEVHVSSSQSHCALNEKIEDLKRELEQERNLRKILEERDAACQLPGSSEQDDSDGVNQDQIHDTKRNIKQKETSHSSGTSSPSQSPKKDQEVQTLPSTAKCRPLPRDMAQLQKRMESLEEKFEEMTKDQSHKRIIISDEAAKTPSLCASSSSPECDCRDKSESSSNCKPATTEPETLRHCQSGVKETIESNRWTAVVSDGSLEDAESQKFKKPSVPVRKCHVPVRYDGNVRTSRKRIHEQGDNLTSRKLLTSIRKENWEKGGGNDDHLPLSQHNNVSGFSGSSCPDGLSRSMCKMASRDVTVNYTEHEPRDDSSSKMLEKRVQLPRNEAMQTLHRDTYESDYNPESLCSDLSDTVSIADSVLSSLDVHLTVPIIPVKRGRPSGTKQSDNGSIVTPAKGLTHRKQIIKRCTSNADSIVKGIYEVPSDMQASSNKSQPNSQHGNPQQKVGSHQKSYGVTSKSSNKDQEMNKKLRMTPKVVLEKTSLKGKPTRTYTFEATRQQIQSDNTKSSTAASNSKSSQRADGWQSKNLCLSDQQPIPGSKLTKSGKETRRSRKWYTVRYVRGNIQCSHILGARLRTVRGKSNQNARASMACEPDMQCPGCTPPREGPLLDSRSLVPALKKAGGDLCKDHGRLLHALTKHSRKKSRLTM